MHWVERMVDPLYLHDALHADRGLLHSNVNTTEIRAGSIDDVHDQPSEASCSRPILDQMSFQRNGIMVVEIRTIRDITPCSPLIGSPLIRGHKKEISANRDVVERTMQKSSYLGLAMISVIFSGAAWARTLFLRRTLNLVAIETNRFRLDLVGAATR